MTESSSRHLLYLQLRHDLLEGRLLLPPDTLLQLAALALQAEFGNRKDQVRPSEVRLSCLLLVEFNFHLCPYFILGIGGNNLHFFSLKIVTWLFTHHYVMQSYSIIQVINPLFLKYS